MIWVENHQNQVYLFVGHPVDRVKVDQKLHESSYLCEESLHTNFRPLVPFLHVKKFVGVGGGWVLKLRF